MKIYGYIGGHDAADTVGSLEFFYQYYGQLALAANHSMGSIQFIVEEDSAQVIAVSAHVESLGDLLSQIEYSDVLIVCGLSRLGYSTLAVVGILSFLVRKGVKVYSVEADELGWNVEPKVVAFIKSVVTDIMKDVGSHSKKDFKRNESKVLGRPIGTLGKNKLDGHETDIKKLLMDGVSKSIIALRYNISRPALQDFIASRKLVV